MRKTYTTYDQAIGEYNNYFGEAPTFDQITDLYHRYRNNWRLYNGFADWLTNCAA